MRRIKMRRITPIVVILIIIFGITYQISKYFNKETVTVTIVDKERITTSDSEGRIDSYYLIFTDKGSFKLEDELIYGNFRSSDWYGQLRRDSTYTFDVIGYRIGYLSEYQNIVGFSK
jgi:hypothetical protein